jgi:hypothetical protein
MKRLLASRVRSLLVVLAVGSAVLSLADPHRASAALAGACCSPDGSCEQADQAVCEENDGVYQGDGTLCATVQCPVLCGLASAPQCAGECPPGQVCEPILAFRAEQGLTQRGESEEECECVDEPTPTVTPTSSPSATPTSTPSATPSLTPTDTPGMEGSPCEETTDCEGGLVCEGGICARITGAPAASHTGLALVVMALAAAGMATLVRRRSAR